MSTGLLNARQLQDDLHTKIVGQRLEVYEELSSTNMLALERADDAANHGLVLFAEKQTAGRGRMGRTWHAPRGAAVLCSTLLFLDPNSPAARGILLWSALAVHEALHDVCGVDTIIKWPNDLLAGGRKICGILIESKPCADGYRAYAIGVGINCLQHADHFPPEIRVNATSLDLESDQPVDRLHVARQLLMRLDVWLEQSGEPAAVDLRSEWSRHALPLGKRLRILSEGRRFSGTLIELDPEGGILVETDEGGRKLFSAFTTTIELMDDC
ncbi:MAG: biotin--[acetyl-CoA-carboxylase] ligase [Planctomycetota bacterium]|nr:biotin--[acetyl-CoA-carboxylase] ligase [Planctomycetota bacterium]